MLKNALFLSIFRRGTDTLIIADTNEFHPLVNGPLYKNSREPDGTNHPIVIMRVNYGRVKVDERYGSSLVQARKAGLLVGHYCYLIAGDNAAAQGRYFANAIRNHGGFKHGDTVWCDDEEGAGNQAPRVDDFLDAARAILHNDPKSEGVYSGAAFWKAHLGNVPSNVLKWVAAYGQGDPNLPGEDLWQFTDKRVVPGVSGPCDASIFKGNVKDFMEKITPPHPQGPFRHVVPADSNMSIDKLAERRNTSVDFIRDFSLKNLNDVNAAVFNTYMSLRAALHAADEPRPAMPTGMVYYTVNP